MLIEVVMNMFTLIKFWEEMLRWYLIKVSFYSTAMYNAEHYVEILYTYVWIYCTSVELNIL